MKTHPVQTNFTGGEISPLMRGRIDVKKLLNGASVLQNVFVRPQGGVRRRFGTKLSYRTKLTSQSRVLPFIFSDAQAYVLEFGDQYIHFIKNRERLLESTNAEVEGFNVNNNGGLMQLSIKTSGSNFPDDLPAWGDVNTFYAPANNGDITISNNGSGAVRITTTIPTTLRSDVTVLLRSTELTTIDGVSLTITNVANNGSGLYRITIAGHPYITGNRVLIFGTGTTADGIEWTVTKIDANNFDLQGSTFGSASGTGRAHRVWKITRISNTSFDLQGSTYSAPGAGNTALFAHGLLPGDRFYISGATNYPELSEMFHTVKSVESIMAWTIANVAYVNHGGPTGEEAWVIPVEVVTPYLATELAGLQIAQSADVLYITHPNHPPMKLSRLSNDGDRNDWLLSTVDPVDGPYLPLNDISPDPNRVSASGAGKKVTDVYLEISNYAHTANVSALAAFGGADNNKYLEYRDRDQWRLAQLVTGQGTTAGTVNIIDNVMLYMDETLKLKNKSNNPSFVPGTPGNSAAVPVTTTNRYGQTRNKFQQRLDPNNSVQGATAAGTLTAQYANTFGTADVGKYIRAVTTANPPVPFWSLIDGVSGTTGTVVHHAASLAMVANLATGKFVISNEVRTCTITAYRNNVAIGIFASTDVGRLIRLGFGGRWTWGKITGFTSTSVVTVTLYEDMPRDPHNALNIAGNRDDATPTSGITYDWRLGSWSQTSGYPSCIVFHEQRLVFGRSTTEPQTLWMSRSASFEDMSPTEPDGTVTDDCGISYTLVSGKVSPLVWLVSGPVLLVGGLGQEWQVRAASSTNEPITPTNIDSKPQTDWGSGQNLRAISVGPATLFVDRVHRKLREMTYNFELDRHISTDISIVSEHLFRIDDTIVDIDYQKNPFGVVWLVTSNGTLLTMTYEKDHEINAWTRHSIALSGIAESIAIVPSLQSVTNADNKGHDEVYMVVRRIVGGVNTRLIEVLYFDTPSGEFYSPFKLNATPFMDCFTVANPVVGVVSGLDAYEGGTVNVYADGTIRSNQLVVGGQITVPGLPGLVTVGYIHFSRVGIILPDTGAILGTSQTKTRRVNKVGLRVLNTSSVKLATLDFVNVDLKTFEQQFFTGDQVLTVTQSYNKDGGFEIWQDLNSPMEILLVASEGAVYEEQ